MSSQTIETTWKGAMTFETDQPGGTVKLDTVEAVGGNDDGLRPKALMLTALSGCTGMDVASLMRKMRVDTDVKDFTIKVTGTLAEEHPKTYKEVSVVYTFVGNNLNEEKITKAVTLSIERYCGVFEMFRAFAKVSTQIIFKNE